MCRPREQEVVRGELVAVGIYGISAGTRIPSDRTELGVVEDVETLGAELERHIFPDDKALRQRHVKVDPVRIEQGVTASVSKG